MARKARPYWICRSCSHRNLRAHVNCRGPACAKTRPKRRVPKHEEVLRDTTYEKWEALSVEIHGGMPGACGACGRMPSKVRHNDRDHDHDTGKARGLACPGRYGCNMFMPKGLTAERAQKIADYLKRVDEFHASQTERGEDVDTGDGR